MKHSHYHKDVSHLKSIDVYRLLELFEVTCPVAQHIVKKALAAGKRGAKGQAKDMSEIADSANRWLEMREEDAARGPVAENEFDEARVDRVASSHGDGEHYTEVKEPGRPRHLCGACGGGHALHLCQPGD